MMEKLKNITSLRFPEFEGNWEMKKLGEIAEKIGDGLHGTPIYSDDSDIYFINGNNLTNGKIQINENTKKVAKSTFEKNNKGLNKNTILISINGTIGNIAKYNNEKVMLGKSVGYYNFKESSDFYYHVLKSDLIQNFFISELTGSTIKNLSLRTLREAKIPLPTLSEQTKIASFLTAVDDKLTALKQKKTLLEQYKKGVMQKIFSQELRFNDDNGNEYPDWEEKKLGDICDLKKGKQLNKEELTERGEYPCINGGINVSGYTDKFNTLENTITISEGGNSCGYINFFKVKFWSGGHNYSIEINDSNETVNDFLYHLLKHNEIEIMKLRVGSGLPNIQKKDLIAFQLLVPTIIDEQTKIANFLSAIDYKINHCGVQIEKTEVWKKGLLQQMFV